VRDNLRPPFRALFWLISQKLLHDNTSPEEALRDNASYHTKETTESGHSNLLSVHLTMHRQ